LLKAAVVVAGAVVLYNIFKPRHDRHRRRIHNPAPGYRHRDYDYDDYRHNRRPQPSYGPTPHRPQPRRPDIRPFRPAPRPPVRNERPRPHK
jgi:hypothetical protein